MLLAAQIGQSDCEAIRDAVVAQPVNTMSSAAYVVAGLWLVLRAIRTGGGDAATQIIYGIAVAGVGVGSVAFHGPMPSSALLIHDAAIVAVFAVIAARALGTMLGWTQASWILLSVVLTLVVGILLELSRAVGLATAAVIAVAGLGLAIHLVRNGGQRPFARPYIRMSLAFVLLLAAAGAVNVFGRTGFPLCDPDSVLQGHALWHVLTAAAAVMLWDVAFPAERTSEVSAV